MSEAPIALRTFFPPTIRKSIPVLSPNFRKSQFIQLQFCSMPMQRMLNYSSIFINLGPEPLKFTSQDYPAKTNFSLPVGLDLSDKALGSLGFFVSTLYHTSQIRPFVFISTARIRVCSFTKRGRIFRNPFKSSFCTSAYCFLNMWNTAAYSWSPIFFCSRHVAM